MCGRSGDILLFYIFHTINGDLNSHLIKLDIKEIHEVR